MPPKAVSKSKQVAAPPKAAPVNKSIAKPAEKAPASNTATSKTASKATTKTAGKTVKGKTAAGKTAKKPFRDTHSHLFTKTPRDFRIGRAIQPKRDLSRFVRWPRYIRIQRQRAILKTRLKVPPPINHFTHTIDKNQASVLFKLLNHYRPETHQQKLKRLASKAKDEAKGQDSADPSKKPRVLKFGLHHITTLVEQKKARLVVIANDVDPIELVVWLPALCRKLDIPYCIVKNKARLGQLTHQKTCSVVALTDVRKEHQTELEQLANTFRTHYNDNVDRKKWGGGIMGVKAQAVQRLRQKIIAREAAKQPRV